MPQVGHSSQAEPQLSRSSWLSVLLYQSLSTQKCSHPQPCWTPSEFENSCPGEKRFTYRMYTITAITWKHLRIFAQITTILKRLNTSQLGTRIQKCNVFMTDPTYDLDLGAVRFTASVSHCKGSSTNVNCNFHESTRPNQFWMCADFVLFSYLAIILFSVLPFNSHEWPREKFSSQY